MTVEVGSVYKNSNGNMVLLVLACSEKSARCVVIWTNEDVNTAYRSGEVDSWSLALVKEHWQRVN